MTFQIVTEPIDHWPDRDTKDRESVRFKASYSDTLNLLNRELYHLDATGPVVIQVVTRNGASDLRRDGLLRAQAKIEHPGVRLSLQSRIHGPLTYATDRYEPRWSGDMPGWQANLRAVALGLEALRAVDRHGITRRGEQYRGFRAIEGTAAMGEKEALAVLRKWAGWSGQGSTETTLVDKLLRLARIGAHPDRHGGDDTGMREIYRACAALGIEP